MNDSKPEPIEGMELSDTISYRMAGKMVRVSGEIDMDSAERLRQKLERALKKKPQAVIVDLSLVTRMDSSGVAVLLEAIQLARKEKIVLVLQDPSPAARSVLEVARVDKLFMVSSDPGADPKK